MNTVDVSNMTPRVAYDYATTNLKRNNRCHRHEILESVIKTSPFHSILYDRCFLEDRCVQHFLVR